jgi:hypothetical protein
MSISSINSLPPAPVVQNTQPISQGARAVDGDYTTRGAGRSTSKDSDGDYKPVTTQATASGSVQAALTSLKSGGA